MLNISQPKGDLKRQEGLLALIPAVQENYGSIQDFWGAKEGELLKTFVEYFPSSLAQEELEKNHPPTSAVHNCQSN